MLVCLCSEASDQRNMIDYQQKTEIISNVAKARVYFDALEIAVKESNYQGAKECAERLTHYMRCLASDADRLLNA